MKIDAKPVSTNVEIESVNKELLEAAIRWAQDEHFRYLMNISKTNVASWYEAVFHQPHNYYCSICFKGKVIGYIGLNNINTESRTAEIVIAIGEQRYRNQGLGRKALCAFIKHIINVYPIEKIIAKTRKDNAPSIALFSSSGFLRIDNRDQQAAIFELRIRE